MVLAVWEDRHPDTYGQIAAAAEFEVVNLQAVAGSVVADSFDVLTVMDRPHAALVAQVRDGMDPASPDAAVEAAPQDLRNDHPDAGHAEYEMDQPAIPEWDME